MSDSGWPTRVMLYLMAVFFGSLILLTLTIGLYGIAMAIFG